MISVVAKIYYLTPAVGGRLTPARSGYCPSIRFGDIHVMGAIEVEGGDTIALGEELQVRIHFPEPDSVCHLFNPNQRFEITEGSRKVGEGRLVRRITDTTEHGL